MKAPLPRGTAIDNRRMQRWLSVFSGYRFTVNEGRIDRWLEQFTPADRDLAARTLDCVDFMSGEQIAEAFRSVLNRLDGWHRDHHRRKGKWRFAAFSGSAGESGDSMLHQFRLANGLSSKNYDELFIHRSQLLKDDIRSEDTVVFVDDFAGTGSQAYQSWNLLRELLPTSPRVFLVLVAACSKARERIMKETDFAVVPHQELSDADNIFSGKCTHFTTREKQQLLHYCTIGDPGQPKGYGDCGLVIVFAHNCPNNSIPILHASHRKWEGLFRRND